MERGHSPLSLACILLCLLFLLVRIPNWCERVLVGTFAASMVLPINNLFPCSWPGDKLDVINLVVSGGERVDPPTVLDVPFSCSETLTKATRLLAHTYTAPFGSNQYIILLQDAIRRMQCSPSITSTSKLNSAQTLHSICTISLS